MTDDDRAALESPVIGAGQAGLAASYFLRTCGIDHLDLDANPRPGGAWQHPWCSLRMDDVHGVADLPDSTAPAGSQRAAHLVVPDYFDGYERRHHLPVARPVRVDRVESAGELLVVHAAGRRCGARTTSTLPPAWQR